MPTLTSLSLMLLASTSLSIEASQAPQPNARPEEIKVAVIGFRPDFGGASEVLIQSISAALAKKRGIVLVERDRLSTLMEEVKLTEQGIIEDTKGLEMGNFSGIDYLVYGSILNFSSVVSGGRDYQSRQTIIDVVIRVAAPVEKGKLRITENIRGTSNVGTLAEGQQNAINQVANTFASKMTELVAVSDVKVIDVEDTKEFKRITIGLGARDSVRKDDQFQIGYLRKRNLVIDGNPVVKMEFTRVCDARITQVEDEYSNAIVGDIGKNILGRPEFKKKEQYLKTLLEYHKSGETSLVARWIK